MRAARAAVRFVRFRARLQVNDFLPLSRRDPIAFEGARRAWAGALAAAGVGLDDLDVVSVAQHPGDVGHHLRQEVVGRAVRRADPDLAGELAGAATQRLGALCHRLLDGLGVVEQPPARLSQPVARRGAYEQGRAKRLFEAGDAPAASCGR